MSKPLPSPELLRKLLRYNPETGFLYWMKRSPDLFYDSIISCEARCKQWNTRYAGNRAFVNRDNKGYYKGGIFGRNYKAHRIIWAMGTGRWPVDQIDHINHNSADNRFANLREVSHQENGRNSSMSSKNTSGFTGVSWSNKDNVWTAHIKISGKSIYLGGFANKLDAIAARKKANFENGFHDNHGRILGT